MKYLWSNSTKSNFKIIKRNGRVFVVPVQC